MKAEPICPRCGSALRPPGLWSSDWQCDRHGAVLPFSAHPRVSPEALRHVLAGTAVPLWVPNPLPAGWLVTGVGFAGDERTGARATVLALSGPAPLGGPGELVLVSEEMGIGLGAGYAGLDATDPGDGFDAGAPHAKVFAAGHPAPLWALPVERDCAAYVGEAAAQWLWAVFWPAAAGLLLLEQLHLEDLRDRPLLVDELPFGAPSPMLGPRPLAH